MSDLRLVLSLLAAVPASAIAMALPASAQDSSALPCRLCTASESADHANARPATPLRLEVETRLDFDKVVFDGNGTAQVALSPSGDAHLSGAATAFGARAMPGTVLVRGEPGRAVTIELPRQVQLFGDGGGSIRIDALATDLPAFPRIGADGTLSFRFGGDLRLSGDSDGAYHGTIDIIVEYL